MTHFWTNNISTLYQADARHLPLADASVHCVVTSPPYYALRSYGDNAAIIGNEQSPEDYVNQLVMVFAEIYRVLRPDGIAWLNLGDSYGGHGQQLGIPWRVAFALQDNGWTLRSDVIWSKKSCMPESMAGTRWDKCRIKTKSQQKGKQLSVIDGGPRTRDMSNGQYLGNAEYIDCPGCDKCNYNDGYVLRQGSWRSTNSHEHIFQLTKGMNYYSDGEAVKTDTQANRRDVWRDISPEPYAGEHFATFPPDLPRLCIQASTSEAGVCGSCGNQWARVVDLDRWKPTCDCNADKIPATVLDPFAGTGTTLLAAQRLGRSSVGVDLSKDYLNQAVKRLSKETLPMRLI
jgi:site-specific DNA-methyltransferase (adenine-specific)